MSPFDIAFRLVTDAFAFICLWRIAKRGIDSAMVAALKVVVETLESHVTSLSEDVGDAEERIAELEDAVFEDDGDSDIPVTVEAISLDELGAKELK